MSQRVLKGRFQTLLRAFLQATRNLYLCVCRDAGIDPKYLQPDEVPPPTRQPVPGVGRGGVSRGGTAAGGAASGGGNVARGGSGGGTALTHRNKDLVQGTAVNRPVSQPRQFSQPPQLPVSAPAVRMPQVPLSSSYFPNKS